MKTRFVRWGSILMAWSVLLWGSSAIAASTATATPDATSQSGNELVLKATTANTPKSPKYKPLGTFTWKDLVLETPLLLGSSFYNTSAIPVDADRTEFGVAGAIVPQVRVGVKLNTGRTLKIVNLVGEYQHDILAGTVYGAPVLGGTGMPHSTSMHTALRKAFLRASFGRYLHLQGGLTTSHWGLGLVANDGTKNWQPGSAQFTDPRGGDRVLRAQLATGPHSANGWMAFIGADQVWDDDILFLEDELKDVATSLGDDKANQIMGAVIYGYKRPNHVGAYVAHRNQMNSAGRRIVATVVDVTGAYETATSAGKLKLAAEAVLVSGKTTMASSPTFPKSDILQLGGVVRASLSGATVGGVLDIVYASGDHNYDDGRQTAFKADPNFDVGMLLFEHVLAAQTGRGVHTASDPDLVGKPSSEIERFPTRGSLSNSIAAFPRLWWSPIKSVELYGGPLIAFSAARTNDPLNSRLAGGAFRNALNGEPGSYLGTELDFGLRYRTYFGGSELTTGAEVAVFAPGTAFNNDSGNPMRPIYGGRFMLQYRL